MDNIVLLLGLLIILLSFLIPEIRRVEMVVFKTEDAFPGYRYHNNAAKVFSRYAWGKAGTQRAFDEYERLFAAYYGERGQKYDYTLSSFPFM